MPREFDLSDKAIDYFWNHIKIDELTRCWHWTGGVHDQSGYGRFTVNYKSMLAHRFSYRVFTGEYDSDLCILHKCDNPPCVNPDHLFTGTKTENNRDRHAKGRDKKFDRVPSPGREKLTPLQTDAILVLHASGEFADQEIAQIFGVAGASISRVVNRQRKFQRPRAA